MTDDVVPAPPAASLHINWTRCDGRAVCVELLPDVLTRDDWGYPIATAPSPRSPSNVDIAAEDLAAAQDAVALCPVLALTLLRTERKR